MGTSSEKKCPKCQSASMKAWSELTDEQKFLVERLPGNVDFTTDERKKHRFCTRCWFETDNAGPVTA